MTEVIPSDPRFSNCASTIVDTEATGEEGCLAERSEQDITNGKEGTCLNTLHVVSLYMQGVSKRGDYYEGYIDGEEDFKRFMADFQLATHSFNIRRSATRRSTSAKAVEGKWSCENTREDGVKSKAKYQKFGEEGYILWESLRGHTPIHFDCVPFRVDQSFLYECCYGPQRSSDTRGVDAEDGSNTTKSGRKRRFRTNSTRKLGCPAKIYVRRVARFPDYRVPERQPKETPNRYRNVKQTTLERLREALKNEVEKAVSTEERYYLSVPDKSAHKIHPSDETAGLGQPVNPLVINKIYDFVKAGITDVNVVKKLLRDSVENMLFKNLHYKPSQLNRAYYPFNKDIRNHIYRAKYLMKLGKIDDASFKKKIGHLQADGSPSDFFLAMVDSQMKGEEIELDVVSDDNVAEVEVIDNCEYLPDQYRQSLMESALAAGAIKAFNPSIPDFLKGKPAAVVKHCMARLSQAECEWEEPQQCLRQDDTNIHVFEVTNTAGDETYKVDISQPSCECPDWWQYRLPCKHMFLLFRSVEGLSWDDFPEEYREKPQFTLDGSLFVCEPKEQIAGETEVSSESTSLDLCDVAMEDAEVKTELQRDCLDCLEAIKQGLKGPLMGSVLRDLLNALQSVQGEIEMVVGTVSERGTEQRKRKHSEGLDRENWLLKRARCSRVDHFNQQLRKRRREALDKAKHHGNARFSLSSYLRRSHKKSKLRARTYWDLCKQEMVFPSWGGKWVSKTSCLPVLLNNTSAIDNWMAIFRVILEEDCTFAERIRITCGESAEELISWLCLVRDGRYLELKALLARSNDLKVKNSSVNFFGKEYESFIHHVGFLFAHTVKSKCSSVLCPRGDVQEESCAIPKISGVRNVLSKADILEQLKDWIEGAEASRCLSKFEPDAIPEGAPVHAEKVKNLDEGREETHYYCNGIRYFQKKVFPHGVPLMLVIGVEYIFRHRMIESLDIIPDKLEGQSYTLKLVAVTLWSKTHYTCKLNIDGTWYHYDSSKRQKLTRTDKKERWGYIPSFCVYLNVT